MPLISSDRVLVPLDFSEEALKALKETLDYVGDASKLYAVHVLPRREVTEPGVVWDTLTDDARKENVTKAFQEKLGDPKYADIHFHVSIGDPSAEILDYAKTNSIQLIVMPSHGRTGLSRFFIGSVAERVVRYAHCPVLVLRS
jgi:nucleotide-binding universal stress UspA family protein